MSFEQKGEKTDLFIKKHFASLTKEHYLKDIYFGFVPSDLTIQVTLKLHRDRYFKDKELHVLPASFPSKRYTKSKTFYRMNEIQQKLMHQYKGKEIIKSDKLKEIVNTLEKYYNFESPSQYATPTQPYGLFRDVCCPHPQKGDSKKEPAEKMDKGFVKHFF